MKKLNYLIGCVLLLSFTSIHAQDNCADAASFTNDAQPNTQYCFNNTAISTAVGLPAPTCGAAPANDMWTTFTISSGPLDIEIATTGVPGGRDVNFEVYSSTGPCTGLVSIGCANAGGNGVNETIDMANLPNGTYYVRFYSVSNTINSINLCITATTPVAPLANDDCVDAIPVAVGANGICTEVTGTNAGATDSGVGVPSCSSYLGGDVWFSITVPASGNVTFASDYSAATSLTDIGMAIYSGTCGSLTEIDCDDDSGNGLMSSISASGLAPGTTVYVRVWEYGNNETGNFDLCFSEPPLSDANQDCNVSTGICSDATLAGASNGAGSVADLDATNQGCLFGENESSWFNLEISTPGTFEFALSPDNGTDDYDFAVWLYPGGAGVGCPPTAAPDRCSFGAGSGLNGSYDTGLGQGAVDPSEGAAGDNWVSTMNVNAGDVIVILIDNFSSTTSPFTLDFTGTAGLDCAVVLPVELMTFYGETVQNTNRLHWKTASEYNNDYFTIEHSVDAENWRIIGSVNGRGNTSETQHYAFDHTNVSEGLNYYRLYQTDIDGTESNAKIISLNNSSSRELVRTINLMGQEVDVHYRGVVIDMHSDGTSTKRLQ